MNKHESHPADVADHLERMPAEEAQQELQDLSNEEGAAVLVELDEDARPAILENMDSPHLAEFVKEMPHEDAADLLSSLPDEKRGEVLELIPRRDQEQISILMSYPSDTAGGIMSDDFICLHDDLTIEQVQWQLRGKEEEESTKSIAYLYVVDSQSRLVGIITLHQLVFGHPTRRLGDIMNQDVKHLWVDDDQEKIANLFDHYHYMALPVLERNGKLMGIVHARQVIDIMRDEATEDMQLMVGLSGEERVLTPWRQSIKKRLPWLCVNLATAFLAAGVVGMFEETIAAWTALAIFLPIVAGQGGNAGAQTLTVIIRDMALGEISDGDGKKALVKELILGLANGIAIGLIVALISILWKGSAVLGLVVGLAMVLNMVAAALSGVMVPYTLRALKIDPALASSIMVTTVTDVAGFFFFLGLAAIAAR
ncbi:MAG: magnesium transporter [Verrucomicrobiales bacterium]